MTNFCSKCGTRLNPGESFCHQCGAGVVQTNTAPPVTDQARPVQARPAEQRSGANNGASNQAQPQVRQQRQPQRQPIQPVQNYHPQRRPVQPVQNQHPQRRPVQPVQNQQQRPPIQSVPNRQQFQPPQNRNLPRQSDGKKHSTALIVLTIILFVVLVVEGVVAGLWFPGFFNLGRGGAGGEHGNTINVTQQSFYLDDNYEFVYYDYEYTLTKISDKVE